VNDLTEKDDKMLDISRCNMYYSIQRYLFVLFFII